ncbi:MAG: hypothetical protein AAF517_21240, partial [Planctomycetota bacterium]
DSTVLERIPKKFMKFLDKKTIYLAGIMTMGSTECPFLCFENRGNPHVLFFLERGGDPLGNSESFNVMLARARDRQKDLLFIGGDFNNQPFRAFERAKPTKK